MGEQLEEGEIVDDDDDNFEDISDNSIIDCSIGKFVSTNEHLRALSLSSVSETDVTKNSSISSKKRKRKSMRRRNKHLKNQTRSSSRHILECELRESTDEDSDYCCDSDDIKGKLKEAIRIENGVQNCNSSLRTRLKLGSKASYEGDSSSTNDHKIDDDCIFDTQPNHTVDNTNFEDPLNSSDNNIDDTELQNLRLEALKTAVLNKYQKRKKRKMALNNIENMVENKENDNDKINKDISEDVTTKKPCTEANIDDNVAKTNVPLIDPEDDEDLLRAKLLAGLSRKITKVKEPSEQPIQIPVVVPQIQPQVTNVNKPLIHKPVVPKIPAPSKLVINNMKKNNTPVVKPLIINIKADSDSDDDNNTSKPPNQIIDNVSKPPLDDIVDKFLKEQRAKVESQQTVITTTTAVKKVIPPLQKKLPPAQQLVNKKVTQTVQMKNRTKLVKQPTPVKPAMKLLPKSQQLEYQRLLKRLKNAEIKQKLNQKQKTQQKQMNLLKLQPKSIPSETIECDKATITTVVPSTLIKNISETKEVIEKIDIEKCESATTALTGNTAVINKVVTATTTTTTDNPTNLNNINNNSSVISSSDTITTVPLPSTSPKLDEEKPVKLENIVKIETEKSGVLNQLATLQKTLREIRIHKNGSLQMKNKYQVLTPIMKKINEASKERKKYESIVKKLLRELNDARSYLTKSHEKFSEHVRELVEKKAMIDKSHNTIISGHIPKNNKIINQPKNHQIETIKDKLIEKQQQQKIIVTSTPLKKEQGNELPFDESTSISLITNDKNNTCEDMELCSNNEDDPPPIEIIDANHVVDIVDPNDIDQIYKKRPAKSHVPEYISPLNNYERFKMDPYGIICPYEVNGSCRDSDCTFKHFLKNPEQR